MMWTITLHSITPTLGHPRLSEAIALVKAVTALVQLSIAIHQIVQRWRNRN